MAHCAYFVQYHAVLLKQRVICCSVVSWETREAGRLAIMAVVALRELAVGGDGSAINSNNIFFRGMRWLVVSFLDTFKGISS